MSPQCLLSSQENVYSVGKNFFHHSFQSSGRALIETSCFPLPLCCFLLWCCLPWCRALAWNHLNQVQFSSVKGSVTTCRLSNNALQNQNHDLAGGVTIGISDNSLSLALSVGCGCGSLCMKHVNEASEVSFVFTYFYLHKKSSGTIALPDLYLAPPMNEHKGIHTARLNHSLPLCAVLRCQRNINQTVPSSSWRHLLTNPKARRQRP